MTRAAHCDARDCLTPGVVALHIPPSRATTTVSRQKSSQSCYNNISFITLKQFRVKNRSIMRALSGQSRLSQKNGLHPWSWCPSCHHQDNSLQSNNGQRHNERFIYLKITTDHINDAFTQLYIPIKHGIGLCASECWWECRHLRNQAKRINVSPVRRSRITGISQSDMHICYWYRTAS